MAPEPALATGGFQAGAAKVDITPVPGYPMGGHSIGGSVGRGFWTRLNARAIYLEDAQGRGIVLVACDLWSLPAGLADRVAERVRTNALGRHLGRDQIVIAATHTHQSPGNFSSCAIYNNHASPRGGFDRALFEFLAQRISASVTEAVAAKQPARVFFTETTVAGVARNRSFPALALDGECAEVLAENGALPNGPRLPDYPDAEAYRAVDPKLKVLRVERADGSALIAMAAFYSVHATAMSHETKFYHADLFGVATTEAEAELRKSRPGGPAPVVALFNGAEGDISPAWEQQDRSNTLRLGRRLSTAMLELATGGTRVDGDIAWRFNEAAPLAGWGFTNAGGTRLHTADFPLPGAPQLGGAEDGRTVFFYNGYVEGMTGPVRGDQGGKLAAADLRWLYWTCFIPFTRIGLPNGDVPREVPLGVYQIGAATNVALATLPGEFTVVMGRRIANAVSNSLARPPARVLLAGLANEYVSYFATPEEYAAQHYEGASTLYGPQSGPVVGRHLTDLAAQIGQPETTNRDRVFEYKPGSTRDFGVRGLTNDTRRELDEALRFVVAGFNTNDPAWQDKIRCHEWDDALPMLKGRANKTVVPRAGIERQAADGSWTPLLVNGVPESNEGLNFVTYIAGVGREDVRWRVAWIPPMNVDRSATLRFRIEKLDGRVIHSQPFVLGP